MNIANDLFLLMFHLSLLNNEKKIIKLFCESMGEIFKPILFSFSKNSESDHATFKLRTDKYFFGYIKIDKSETLSKNAEILIYNAVQMLAVLLERQEFETKIQKEKELLREDSQKQIIKLQEIVDEFNESKSISSRLAAELSKEINKRVQYEKDLLEKEEKLRLLADFTYDWEYWLDPNGHYEYISPSCKKITGYTRDEFISDPSLIFDIAAPEYRDVVESHYKTINIETPDCEIVFPIITKNNEKKWLHHYCTNIFDHKGNYLGRRGTNRDITEQKTAQDNLKISEEKFRSIFYDHSAIKFIIDPESGDIIEANNAAAEFYGWSVEKLETMNISQIINLHITQLEQEINNIKKGNKDRCQLKHKKSDGSFADVQMFCSKVKIENKEYIHAIMQDITEQKLLEEEQQLLSQAINHSNEVVVITDCNGEIEYVNSAFEKLTGYSRSEAIGENPRILKSGKQDAAFYKDLWDTISQGLTWEGNFVNCKKDNSLYTEKASISPVFDVNGEITKYIAVKKDVTKEKELEEQLRQSQKMESIGRLSGGIAHDYNNILTIILNYAELASLKLNESDELWGYLQEIKKAGERSSEITNQLLAFARKQSFNPAIINLNNVIKDMLNMLKRLIGESINLEWEPGSKLYPVKMDISQVNQILVNLCINAKDAINGAGKIKIKTENISIENNSINPKIPQGDYVMITVTDTGCGMDKETIENIFEPFFTTKEIGSGSGLGLSTVYGIIKQNNGFIDVHSKPKQGTTFYIYLKKEYDSLKKTKYIQKKDSPAGKGETVLLVEDEIAILQVTQKILENLGYNVLTAATPKEAIRIAEKSKNRINILLTDVVMPEMNGKELSEKVLEKHRDVKILFTSGYNTNVISQNGMVHEDTNFIPKPFNERDLAIKIRNVLDKNL